ncbi:hypothetical protein Tco_0173033 [Tanacetum coccineum]
MSAMANTTPIVTTVMKPTTKEKTPKEADATPRVNIQDFCEEHYEDILPVIMDKIRRDKQKEVHARLDFEETDSFDLYLYKPCPGQPADTATEAKKAAFKAEYKKHSDVACIMLGKMSPALQRQFENYPPQNMLDELRKMFEKPPL